MNALLPPPTDFICLGSAVCWLRLALVGPLPALGFLLQAVAVGTAIGSAVALQATRRHRHADTWAITTAWASLALGVGSVVELVSWWT
jgi:hypothetical protein